MFLAQLMYTPCSNPTLAQSMLNAMAPGYANQTTPVQMTQHVFVLCCSIQISCVQF